MPKQRGICSIPDCGKPHEAQGYCNNHYYRYRTHGDPLAGRTAQGELQRWIDDRLDRNEESCLIWPFSTDKDGYAIFRRGGKNVRVNRYVCEKTNGPPPLDADEAAHSCRNPSCVNKAHIRWATHRENLDDKYIHGTIAHGMSLPQTILTAIQAVEIYQRAWSRTESHSTIAKSFGVSASVVFCIKHGKTWSRYTGHKRNVHETA